MRTAGNKLIESVGQKTISVRIGQFKTQCTALVLRHVPTPFILGNNFIKQNKGVINYDDNFISFNNTKIYLNAPHQIVENIDSLESEINRLNTIQPIIPENKPVKVTLLESITVAAGENSIIKCSSPLNVEKYKLIPNNKILTTKKIELVSYSPKSNNCFEVIILSYAQTPTKLIEGTTIAYLVKRENAQMHNIFTLDNYIKTQTISTDEISVDHLSLEERQVFNQLISDFSNVFASNNNDLGFTNLQVHEIKIDNTARPIKSNPYRTSFHEKQIIEKQVDEMLRNNIIRPSKSPWSSPVVLVKKKDDSLRFCVDYRKLNSITVRNNYPLPLIEDVLNSFEGSKYFSSLDLLSGYWQVGVKEEHKELTAFCTHNGLYEFNVLPFGLCNAPATFQALADTVFHGLKWKDVLIYLDDIIIFSKTFDEHIIKLRHVFQRLQSANLKLKPSKCSFLAKEVKILGFLVSEKGVKTDPDKIAAIEKFPPPKKIKDVQSFLGTCNFYRKFIKNYSMIAKPLHEATKKNGFVWGAAQDSAFKDLKTALSTAPVLAHFNPHADCELRTDACSTGIGAILLQEKGDEKHPIAFISRSLTKAEKNYTISELEALAVVWSFGYLRHLIFGRHVRVVTDHHALCWLKTCRDPTGKLARWAIKLSEYNYTVVHKSGIAHKDADCLSRNPVNEPTTDDVTESDELETYLLSTEDLYLEQRKDNKLFQLIEILEDSSKIKGTPALRRKVHNYSLINNVLYKKNAALSGNDHLLCIPSHMKYDILFSNHSEPLAGHLGVAKTINRINKNYYWDGLRKDVIKFVRGCPDCQARKGLENKKPLGLLKPIKVGKPFDMIGVDLLGPFRRSVTGKTMVIVATDYATRYAEIAGIKDGKATSVAKFLMENIINRHGCPRTILSDRGQVFKSELVTELQLILGIRKNQTTSYHPSCNGLTERLNKTLVDMLSKFVNTKQTDWCLFLSHISFAYNTAVQETTGYTPFFLLYGREATQPTDAQLLQQTPSLDTIEEFRSRILNARALAAENIHGKQTVDKQRYDANHRDIDYQIGQQVKVFTPVRKVGRSEKLLLRWFGPYIILEKRGDVDYLIQMGDRKNSKTDVVHVSRIAPYYPPYKPAD